MKIRPNHLNCSLTLLAGLLLAAPLPGHAAVINLDFQGVCWSIPSEGLNGITNSGPVYVGVSAAGGGTVWNGVPADSRLPDGTDNEEITFGGTNFVDSYGTPTAVTFTMGPVFGANQNSVPGSDPTTLNDLLLNWVIIGYFDVTNSVANFTFGGLGGAPAVDLYWYSRGDYPGAYTMMGDSNATAFAGLGPFTSGNTLFYQGVPVQDGQIQGQFYVVHTLALSSGVTIVTPPPGLFVSSTAPSGSGVAPGTPIVVQVWNNGSVLDPQSVQVWLNGQAVSPVTSAFGTNSYGAGFWTITANPAAGLFLPSATNTVAVAFADTAHPPNVRTNQFSFVAVGPQATFTVNVDIEGQRGTGTEAEAVNYVGQGAAGGGTVFNGVLCDSTLGDDNLTIGATNMVDSIGGPTTVTFTLSPVAGEREAATPIAVSQDPTDPGNLFQEFAAVGYQGQTSNSANFTISGLGAVPSVDLYFYTYEDPLSAGLFAGTTFTVPGAEASPFPASGVFTSLNTTYMHNVPVVNGAINGVFSTVPSGVVGEGASAGAWSGFTLQMPLLQPYVLGVQPSGGYVLPNATVQVQLQDYTTRVDTNSILLFLNGQAVTPKLAKPSGSAVTTLTYVPPDGLLQETTNILRVVFANIATPPMLQTNDSSFFVISPAKAANIVNIQIRGHRAMGGNPLGPTYLGAGAAGGGSVFNGVIADSEIDANDNNDNLTIGGTNLLNSLGTQTAEFFTMGPVAGGNSGAVGSTYSDNFQVLDESWCLVGYFGNTADLATFTIGGLTNPIVNLYFYFREDPRESGRFGAGVYTMPGVNGPSPFGPYGLFGSQNTTFFQTVPVANGQVTGTFSEASGDPFGIICGLTVEIPQPEVYVKSYSPVGVAATSQSVQIELGEYGGVHLNPASLQLSLNGNLVTPTSVAKPSGSSITTVTYAPAGGLTAGVSNSVQLIFADDQVPPQSQTLKYSFNVVSAVQAAKVVNIAINGVRNPQQPGQTYVGQGAAGGLTVFNGLACDCRLSNGQNDDNITVAGNNLLNSMGGPTTVGFTISPVGGEDSNPGAAPTSLSCLLDKYLWVGLDGQTSDQADFTIDGLGTNATVDLYFYERSDGPGFYSITNAAPSSFTPYAGFNSGNTTYFPRVPVTAGAVNGTFSCQAPAYGLISGLTVVLSPLPPTPGPLAIGWQGNQIAISWPGSGVLQTANQITGPWKDVAGAASPYLVSPSGSAFFRLRQ